MAPVKTLLAPLALCGALLSGLADATSRPKSHQVLGIPISNPDIPADMMIQDSYIVVYNKSYDAAAIDATQASIMTTLRKRNIGKRSLDGRQLSTDMQAWEINGWRASGLDADASTIMSIYNMDAVAYIEQDAKVQLSYVIEKPTYGPVHHSKRAPAQQTQATTGLSRISKAAPGGANSYTFDDSAGEGITVYVVDTGVMASHQDFGGRAVMGFSSIQGERNTDLNGHGSHVAGTVAGSTFGVAKNAQIMGVKVLNADGGGSNRGVIAGMDFVARNATRGKSVMNMSLGGPASTAVNTAINNVRDAGVFPVVAAGNENADTATTSPGSAPGSFTVAAIDQTTDAKAAFSNFGPLVDIYAPGVRVQSVGITSNTAQSTLSGTSMASPHAAGVAAYLMSMEQITDIDALADRMVALATASPARVTGNTRGTTGIILNNGNL